MVDMLVVAGSIFLKVIMAVDRVKAIKSFCKRDMSHSYIESMS